MKKDFGQAEKTKVTEPKIIFEDRWLLVLDKPAGLITDKPATTRDQPTLQDWVEKYLDFGQPGGKTTANHKDFYARSGIVHRLDKETSGLLVVAKTPEIFSQLQCFFKQRAVSKKYLALVHGSVRQGKGIISAPVCRSPFNRKKFGVYLGGRPAVSEYLPIAVGENYSLLEVMPKTGRTHQIRVHLKHIGHPVVGDSLYAGRKQAREDRRWCPRQFLHASFLSFAHPVSHQLLQFKSGLPPDLRRALAYGLGKIIPALD